MAKNQNAANSAAVTANAPKADKNGVFAPVVKETMKLKLSNVLRRSNGIGIFILIKMLTNALLQNDTEALQTIGSTFRALLKDAKISFRGLRAAAQAGEAVIEVQIQSFIKGKPYYQLDGENTYIAGEKLTDVEDGTELHRAVVTKIVVSSKGKAIASATDEKEERIRDFARTNPDAYLKALMGGSVGNPKASAKASEEDDAADELGEEAV